MTELEKLIHAKNYIDSLAEGINPLDGSRIPDGDVINNVRLSRCLFYVSDVLRQVIDNGGDVGRTRRTGRLPFCLDEKAKENLSACDRGIYVKDITEKINSLVDESSMHKLKQGSIASWLVEIEMLEILTDERGKNIKMPTPAGESIGIYTEEKMGMYGTYKSVYYNKEAQQFIYDNIDAVTEFNNRPKEKNEKDENEKKGWDKVQDELIKDLFRNGAKTEEIAAALKRSEGGIRARLKRLGLIEN